VTSTVPSANQQDVGRDVLPTVGFNQPVEPASASGVALVVGGEAVETTISLKDGGARVQLIPRRLLPADTEITLQIAGNVSSTDGIRLESSADVKFHTAP
jgi:hypothetical protein